MPSGTQLMLHTAPLEEEEELELEDEPEEEEPEEEELEDEEPEEELEEEEGQIGEVVSPGLHREFTQHLLLVQSSCG